MTICSKVIYQLHLKEKIYDKWCLGIGDFPLFYQYGHIIFTCLFILSVPGIYQDENNFSILHGSNATVILCTARDICMPIIKQWNAMD